MPSRRLTLCLLPGLDGSGLLYQRLVALLSPEFDIQVLDYPADSFRGYDWLAERLLPRLPSGNFGCSLKWGLVYVEAGGHGDAGHAVNTSM